jgi:hypothetical protein
MAKLIKVTQLRETQQVSVLAQGSQTWINADRIFRIDSVTVEVDELGTAQASRIIFDGDLGRLLVLETPEELAIEIDGLTASTEEVVTAGEDGDVVKVKF